MGGEGKRAEPPSQLGTSAALDSFAGRPTWAGI